MSLPGLFPTPGNKWNWSGLLGKANIEHASDWLTDQPVFLWCGVMVGGRRDALQGLSSLINEILYVWSVCTLFEWMIKSRSIWRDSTVSFTGRNNI